LMYSAISLSASAMPLSCIRRTICVLRTGMRKTEDEETEAGEAGEADEADEVEEARPTRRLESLRRVWSLPTPHCP
jgi:hypothetical protein